MKRKYISLLIGIIVAVLLVMTLLKASVQEINTVSHGFVRKTGAFSLTKLAQHSFDQPLRDIAGVQGDSMFIVTAWPDKIILTNRMLTEEKSMSLPITLYKKLAGNFTTRLWYPDVYIFGSNVPALLKLNLVTGKEILYPIERAFSRSALVSPATIIVRGFDPGFKDEQLQTINLLTGTHIDENGITDKTEGGGFVTDGMLYYDELTNRVVYHFFYSNRILYLDTNLHLIQKGTAIDTFSAYTAKAKAIRSSKGTSFTFTAPPQLLSRGSCVNKGRLFINSRLKADNEPYEQFIHNSVIDVYDIKSAEYRGSLYVPVIPGKRMIKFKVFDDRLYAIYEDQLIVYGIH